MHNMNKKLRTFLLTLLTLSTVQVQAADIALPEMGDSAGALISPFEEFQIGQAFYWRLQQSVDLVEDPEINSYLNNLGYRLAASSDDPARTYTFFMVPDKSVNAFAAPGGFIGINSGLILTADSEDEVASVMAHEIAHVTQRHILRSFDKSERMSIPMTAAMIGAALLGVADPKMASAAMMAVQAGNVQMQLDYTRAHETEADNVGMQTLVRSGYDPQAMPSFFEKLQQASRYYGGDNVPEFLRTHPVTISRIAEARGRATKYHRGSRMTDHLEFYLMREKLRVMMMDNVADLLSYYEKQVKENPSASVALKYGYARALLKSGQYTLAREQLQPLIDNDRDRLTYQLALADIELAVGRTSSALAIYDDYQKLYPDDRALTLKQVTVLLQTGNVRQAAQMLQRQLELGEQSREIYQLLAQAQGDLGRQSQAHSALAEYYYLSGRLKSAADQLRLAAEAAGHDEYERAKIASRLRQVENQLALLEQNE